MKTSRYTLAFLAALAMLTPGVCVCGCPCEMLLAGDSEPADEGRPPTPSCCHPVTPAPGPIVVTSHDCCCDAQKPPTPEASPTPSASIDAGVPLFAAVGTDASPFKTEIEAMTGPDPPAAACVAESTSLHAVLRN